MGNVVRSGQVCDLWLGFDNRNREILFIAQEIIGLLALLAFVPIADKDDLGVGEAMLLAPCQSYDE